MYHPLMRQLQKSHHTAGQLNSPKWQFLKLVGLHTQRTPRATFLASCRASPLLRKFDMVAQREPQHMTVEEWRELERTNPDAKYEYIDGQVYLKSGGSLAHSRISSNTLRAIEDAGMSQASPGL